MLLKFEFTPVGGCEQEVKQDNEILFAFDAFNANSFLKLTGLPIVALTFPVIFSRGDYERGYNWRQWESISHIYAGRYAGGESNETGCDSFESDRCPRVSLIFEKKVCWILLSNYKGDC